MELLYGYILFALTTAIVAVYELLTPLPKMVEEGKVINDWVIVNITFFSIAILVAPFILLPCIIPSMGNRFREALVKELQADKN